VLDIAVNVQDPAAWTPGVEYAAGLAAWANASFTGFHVPPARPLLASLPEDVRAAPVDAAAAERRVFRDHAKERGIARAAWQVVQGYMPDVLAHACNWLDLFVLERNAQLAWGSAAQIGQLVLAGGACVVAPGEWTPHVRVERVLIGWNGSPEAIRAVRAALPLLHRARHVVVLSGATRSHYMANWDPPFDLSAYLGRHAIDHDVLACREPDERAGRTLLEQAERLDADLLVMGACGRSRFSEWMFGGATRDVLQKAPLPVLMKG
jgi:nucleotide-binding universal stress UspA family protein